MPLNLYRAAIVVLAGWLALHSGRALAISISDVRVGAVSTTGAIIRWSTDVAADGQVSYGTSADHGNVAIETESARDHYVFLDGLTPGATYHYHVRSGDATGGGATFTTAAKIEDLWPVVSLSFDDGGISHFTTAFPLMKARNMRGAVNVITDRLANPGKGVMSLTQLHFLERQGWEVDSHSRSHYRDKHLTAEQEIVGSFTYLTEQKFKPVLSYRLPGSNHSAESETFAARTYPLRWGNVKGGPPSPRYATLPLVPGIYSGVPLDARQLPTREERVAKYAAAIDEVLSKHLYTHFIFHAIADLDPPGYNYSPAEFEALLDHLQARGIRVIPPGELLRGQPRPPTVSSSK